MSKRINNPLVDESFANENTEFHPVTKPIKLSKTEKLQAKLLKLKESTKLKVKKARQMPLSRLKKVTQKEVNHYVLLRDKDLPCISCGKNCGTPQCGHYCPQGSCGSLRYNLDNLNSQGSGCNMYKHGNLIMYRQGLVKKIGAKRVELLETHMHDIKKWDRQELEEIRKAVKEGTYGVSI